MSESQTSARRAAHAAAAPLTRVATPHVLIADANGVTRAKREAQLIAAGYRVSLARTAFETIVKASCHVPDLILLDSSLGNADIDTVELSRLLTTCPVTAHIPVLRLNSGRSVPRRVLSDFRSSATA